MNAAAHLEVCECCNELRSVRTRDVYGCIMRLCLGCAKTLRDERYGLPSPAQARDKFQAWCYDFIDEVCAEHAWGFKAPVRKAAADVPFEALDVDATLLELKKSITLKALEVAEGNRNQAAKLLGMKRTTLVERLKKWGL